jgi:membrane protease YdiL (CAAX protease family)
MTAAANAKSLWPLSIFFCLSAAFSWTIWLWPLKQQGWLWVNVLGARFDFPFVLIKLVIGNCVPGILAVVWVLCEGKHQFRLMLSTLTKWRTPLKWYLLAVALPCGVTLISLDAVLFYFPTGHAFPPAIEFFKSLFMTLPFGPLWEELAWRAFALRKLESRYSHLVSALILGTYWAVWHVPLWLLTLNLTQANKIPVLLTAFVNLVAWSVIWAYLYHRSSQSLPVVIFLHGIYVAATSQMFAVVPRLNLYLIYVMAAVSLCLAVPFARTLRHVGMQKYEPVTPNHESMPG